MVEVAMKVDEASSRATLAAATTTTTTTLDADAAAAAAAGDRDNKASSSSSSSSYRAGDVVCTAYGVGVIVQTIRRHQHDNDKKQHAAMQNGTIDDDDDDEDPAPATTIDFFAVRLWRIPGKSMASSALAFLQPSTVCIIYYMYQSQK
jgi:hypothetical protein